MQNQDILPWHMQPPRLLVVNNLFPPPATGGYELGCQDVVQGLQGRGYEVRVLTTKHATNETSEEKGIYRRLESALSWGLRDPIEAKPAVVAAELCNQRAFRSICWSFRPHLVYFWNMRHISISLAFLAQEMRIPTCFFVSDDWLACWENDAWNQLWLRDTPRTFISRVRKKLETLAFRLRGVTVSLKGLDLRRVHFCSQHMKTYTLKKGKPVQDAEVIHWGVPTREYASRSFRSDRGRLLFVGQTCRHKGAHTAIQALALLVREGRNTGLTLTIAGKCTLPGQDEELKDLVVSLGLNNRVRFMGMLPRQALPGLYADHDILVFPSVWEEPFSIALLEAMAAGLAVVATCTGGTGEILQDGVNGLIFPPEDADACASQIERLLNDSELFERIRLNARKLVAAFFTLERMIESIDASLREKPFPSSRATPSVTRGPKETECLAIRAENQ